MAMFDDRSFLLSHIRHSFITCDDSGVCEMALLNEIIPHHLPSEPDKQFLDSTYFLPLEMMHLMLNLLPPILDRFICGRQIRIGTRSVTRYPLGHGHDRGSSKAFQ